MQNNIKLKGYIKANNGKFIKATPQRSAVVWVCNGVMIIVKGLFAKLRTHDGDYLLKKHGTENYYSGTCNTRIVHLILKPMVGNLIWWNKSNKKEIEEMFGIEMESI